MLYLGGCTGSAPLPSQRPSQMWALQAAPFPSETSKSFYWLKHHLPFLQAVEGKHWAIVKFPLPAKTTRFSTSSQTEKSASHTRGQSNVVESHKLDNNFNLILGLEIIRKTTITRSSHFKKKISLPTIYGNFFVSKKWELLSFMKLITEYKQGNWCLWTTIAYSEFNKYLLSVFWKLFQQFLLHYWKFFLKKHDACMIIRTINNTKNFMNSITCYINYYCTI